MDTFKLILFGAGEFGADACNTLNYQVEFFADNDVSKHGKSFCGKEIVSYEELKNFFSENKNSCVMITVKSDAGRKAVAEQLKKDKIPYVLWHPLTRPLFRIQSALKGSNANRFLAIGDVEYIQVLLKLLHMDKMELLFDVSDSSYTGTEEVLLCDDNYFVKLPELQATYGTTIISILGNRIFYDNRNFFVPHVEPVCDEEEARRRIRSNPDIARQDAYVANAINYPVAVPVNVTIETVNMCNGHCSFCPASVENNKQKLEYMSEELFTKLIDELHDWNYRGELALYGNNEPLIDKRIIAFTKYAKEQLPYAEIRLLTNGKLLTVNIFKELVKHLDILCIENYSNAGVMHKGVREVFEYCEMHPEYKEKTTIIMRNETEILSSRGSLASNRETIDDYGEHSCTQPFLSIFVHPNGDCGICCADVYGDYILGNAKEKTLYDIWHSSEYDVVRKRIAGGRKQMERCKNCDQFIIYR